MNILNLDQSKVITDQTNSYFKNNRFMIGSELPTSGSYNVGDIIINTGETSLTEPMWICIESGEPGVWQVTGSGNSSSRAICVRNQVIVDSAVSEVELGIGSFSKATDTLLVFINADYAYENVDYVISGNKIVAVDGKWNKVGMNDFTFDFIMFKSVSTENISSTTEIVSLQNYVVLEADTNEVEIGIDSFINEVDLLTVYKNSVFLTENKDYIVESNKIVSTNGNWMKDDLFSFIVIKQVAKLYPNAVVTSDHIVDGTITLNKLSSSVQQMLGVAGDTGLNDEMQMHKLTNNDGSCICITGQDLNLLTKAGYYYGENLGNAPAINWYYVEVFVRDADNIYQRLTQHNTGIGKYERRFKNGAWDNWRAINTGDLNDLQTTHKNTLVGAINELFQSANNGKELIASAIGEPVSAEDTFQAMSDDINGLLSTFKTNMMNNGVTVEANDRFKNLIDKIATMVEEGSGKGIQFIQDSFQTVDFEGEPYYAIVNNIPFRPDVIMIHGGSQHVLYNRFNDEDRYYMFDHVTMECYGGFLNNVTDYVSDNGFSLYTNSISGMATYYAIGVGEEDTTLRDSLADILENKGVEITEDDDMASLITKVETKLNESDTSIFYDNTLYHEYYSDGSLHPFRLISSGTYEGFYENTNIDVDESHSIMKIHISNPNSKNVYFDWCQDSEEEEDYGYILKPNTYDGADSLHEFDDYKERMCLMYFKDQVHAGTYSTENLGAINGFIVVGYMKDVSGNVGTDTFKFRIRLG